MREKENNQPTNQPTNTFIACEEIFITVKFAPVSFENCIADVSHDMLLCHLFT